MNTQVSVHTPLPWVYEPGDSGDPSVGVSGSPPTIYDCDPDNPVVIAILNGPAYHVPATDEYDEGLRFRGSIDGNAAFILRACNSYYDLLAACELTLSEYFAWQGEFENEPGPLKDLLDVVKAAIAKATGGAA